MTNEEERQEISNEGKRIKLSDYCTHNIDGSHCELGYIICDGTACGDYDCCDKEMD